MQGVVFNACKVVESYVNAALPDSTAATGKVAPKPLAKTLCDRRL